MKQITALLYLLKSIFQMCVYVYRSCTLFWPSSAPGTTLGMYMYNATTYSCTMLLHVDVYTMNAITYCTCILYVYCMKYNSQLESVTLQKP